MNSQVAIQIEPQRPQTVVKARPHIEFFDGMRGWLCVYVMIFHTAIMSGVFTRLLPGPIAVDLFMLISGFFMTYTLTGKKSVLTGDLILAFYLRRILRVIPVYYIVLLVVLSFLSTLTHFAAEASTTFPPLWAAEVHNDPSYTSVNSVNVLLHLTFLFGLNPHYASNLPIPDWSLALEMQFYAIIPFMLIAFRKYGLTIPFAILAVVNYLTLRYVGLYLEPKIGGLWPQPSFIAFKIDCFLTGILLCFYFFDEKYSKIEVLGLLIISLALEGNVIFSLVLSFSFTCLQGFDHANILFIRIVSAFSRLFQTRVLHFFSIISYDLYLIHPMILLTVMHFLLKSERYVASPPLIRFGILLSIAMMIVAPVSYLLHITVERPCQNASRAITNWVIARKNGVFKAV